MSQNRYRNLQERLLFLSVLCPDTGCWIFLGTKDRDGYGRLNVRRNKKHQSHRAHRLAYEEFVGKIPVDHDVDHKCEVRACINPNHLVPRYYVEHRQEAGWPTANRGKSSEQI